MSDDTKYYGTEIQFGLTPSLVLVDTAKPKESCTTQDAILGTVFPENCFRIGSVESKMFSVLAFQMKLVPVGCKVQ